jgi:hypothetical protein
MLDECEWQTRKQRIDTKLRALNPAWKIVKYQDSLDTSQLDRHTIENIPPPTARRTMCYSSNGNSWASSRPRKSPCPRKMLERIRAEREKSQNH